MVVPAGYTASVLYALGDPLTGTTPAYKNDGSDTDHENRVSRLCHARPLQTSVFQPTCNATET
ncbi:hypothetical protein [Rhodoferax sp.]|uniref:hypothetical protein n=1 Tax=Rhodoferax sp. TaxID=50421 RepID=UPI003BB78DEE